MQTPLETPILLFGWITDSLGYTSKGYILAEEGIVTYMGIDKPAKIPAGTIEITLAADEIIFPGFLDLHTHVNYNMLPIWDYTPVTGIDRFDNRFEWRANDVYKRQIEDVYHKLREEWHIPAYKDGPPVHLLYWVFSELQAIAGGTTVLQETEYLEKDGHYENEHVLVRSTGVPTDLGLTPDQMIDTAVDFFVAKDNGKDPAGTAPQDTRSWTPDPTSSYEDYLQYVKGDKVKGALVHLAEGRSGFLQAKDGVDPYTRKEFETFKQDCYRYIDPQQMKKTHMTFIHGCGIDEENPDTIQYMKDYGTSVIWSPVSNLLLYKDTLSIFPLLARNIDVAIGSDWSPSGSKNAWAEAKFAKRFLDTIGVAPENTPWIVYPMITRSAANTINLNKMGTIKVGGFADFCILRSSTKVNTYNALEILMNTPDSQIRCVTVGGRPIYGDEDILKHFEVSYQKMPKDEGPYASNKAVHYPDELNIDLAQAINSLDQILASCGVKRSKFLVSDDPVYQQRIANLEKWVKDNYTNYLGRTDIADRYQYEALKTKLSSPKNPYSG